jgi:hypothetical protein
VKEPIKMRHTDIELQDDLSYVEKPIKISPNIESNYGIELLSFANYNRRIILFEKQYGRRKKICVGITHPCADM